MIIVIAQLSVKPGKKAEVFALAQDLIAATRAEEGCISYTLLDDPADAGSCSFVEEWSDKQALKKHFTTPHIQKWREQSADLFAGQTVIKLYEAEKTTL